MLEQIFINNRRISKKCRKNFKLPLTIHNRKQTFIFILGRFHMFYYATKNNYINNNVINQEIDIKSIKRQNGGNCDKNIFF